MQWRPTCGSQPGNYKPCPGMEDYAIIAVEPHWYYEVELGWNSSAQSEMLMRGSCGRIRTIWLRRALRESKCR